MHFVILDTEPATARAGTDFVGPFTSHDAATSWLLDTFAGTPVLARIRETTLDAAPITDTDGAWSTFHWPTGTRTPAEPDTQDAAERIAQDLGRGHLAVPTPTAKLMHTAWHRGRLEASLAGQPEGERRA
ncbi:hypothetical protein [Leifsonia shinshuensis]